MKLLLGMLLISALSAIIFEDAPRPRRTQLVKRNSSTPNSKRKLFLDDLKNTYSSYENSLMSTTNAHIDQMQNHNRINSQMRQMGSWFGDLDMTVDEYRDSVSKKLEQLNISLQRPKIPVPGFGAGLVAPFAALSPYAGSMLPTTTNAFSSAPLLSGTQSVNQQTIRGLRGETFQ